jgi:beta-phosphoglucomutase-like phosphatase (HAD superfamily)
MLRAIVFDFDGVIADSEPLHFRGYRDVLVEEGIQLTKAEYYARYLGYDDVGAFEHIAADRRVRWSPSDIERLVARKAIRLEELERTVSILFPGAAAAVQRAAAAVPIAIASGARGEEIRRVLEREGLLPLFAAVVAAEDTPASKPAPDPYLRALSLLASTCGGQLAAGECVAIEDSRWGLESARSAGMHTVAVTTTYAAADLEPFAELVIASLDALHLDDLRRLIP